MAKKVSTKNVKDDVTVKVTPGGGGPTQTIGGWLDVTIVRGLELCPNTFDVSFTAKTAASDFDIIVNPGDAAQVYIGADRVITGYINHVLDTDSAGSHSLRLAGRGKCQDLVDCNAEWPGAGGQIMGASALEVAQKLAAPYGVAVQNLGPAGANIPQFNLVKTETAWQIIEEVCRFSQLLAYEDVDGSLILNQVSTARAASGFVGGQNIQESTFSRSDDQRFSEYDVFLMNMDVMSDTGQGGNQIGQAKDANVQRHRMRAIIAEAPAGGQNIAEARAIWECARRAGRSTVVNLTTDVWRDSAGALWTPNTVASVSLPKRNFGPLDMTLSKVTYRKSQGSGTTAEIELMPGYAFLPEPILLLPPVAGVNA